SLTVGNDGEKRDNDLVWFDGASLMLSWIHYTYSRHLLERRMSVIGDLLLCRLANRLNNRVNKPPDKKRLTLSRQPF
ncbi:hypothetical protein, partial [Vibrio sp. 10N.286.48.F5]|uniref:hypothetical protein n=1 Tax=Vibrio sp. 10N.286.48.F5 TaxID=3229699 RepID=UPI00354D10ED